MKIPRAARGRWDARLTQPLVETFTVLSQHFAESFLPTSKQVHGDFVKPARERHAQRRLVLGVLEVEVGSATVPSSSVGIALLELLDDGGDDVDAPVGDRQVEGGVATLHRLHREYFISVNYILCFVIKPFNFSSEVCNEIFN